MGRYLTREKGVKAVDDHRDDGRKKREWKGDGIDVLLFNDLNHAEVFATKATRRILIDVAMNNSKGESKQISIR